MGFQVIGTAEFQDEDSFSRAFSRMCIKAFRNAEKEEELIKPLVLLANKGKITLSDMFEQLSILCGRVSKPIVLIIDEVDSASNNQVFLDFLAMLRGYYLDRGNVPAFHSVILAGVYDIKNLKLKIRPESEHKFNSPWNMFITEEAIHSEAFHYGERDHNQFIKNGRLDMDLVLRKFVSHYSDIYGDNDDRFVEEYGRKFFLLYLKPIINGAGNYYMEAQTRDMRRTDVIVDYGGEQFIVELKIWHGNEYNERGEEQLTEYLDYFHQKKGYMLSFNFNKNKQVGMKTIELNGRTIVEAVV